MYQSLYRLSKQRLLSKQKGGGGYETNETIYLPGTDLGHGIYYSNKSTQHPFTFSQVVPEVVPEVGKFVVEIFDLAYEVVSKNQIYTDKWYYHNDTEEVLKQLNETIQPGVYILPDFDFICIVNDQIELFKLKSYSISTNTETSIKTLEIESEAFDPTSSKRSRESEAFDPTSLKRRKT